MFAVTTNVDKPSTKDIRRSQQYEAIEKLLKVDIAPKHPAVVFVQEGFSNILLNSVKSIFGEKYQFVFQEVSFFRLPRPGGQTWDLKIFIYFLSQAAP